MADTTPAAFDPKPTNLGTVINCTAGATILAGQVVGFAGTGVDWTVHPTVAGTTAGAVGVALHSAAAGDAVAVASVGSVVKVCEGKGSAIDAGDYLETCDVAGCVTTLSVAATTAEGIGIAMTDIGANSTGYALISPWYTGKSA